MNDASSFFLFLGTISLEGDLAPHILKGGILSILIAFLAGIFSFITPCVLPMIPSYLTFITGLSLKDFKDSSQSPRVRRVTLIHSLFFILGFTIVFMILGAALSLLSQAIYAHRDLIRQLGGVFIIIMGLYITGVFKRLRLVEKERKFHLENKPVGYLGTMLVGITFAAGWTPCTGPILGAISLMAGTSDTILIGVLQLISYSLGMGLPFLLCALGTNSFLTYFPKISKYIPLITIISGIFLILVGIALIFNLLPMASYALSELFSSGK